VFDICWFIRGSHHGECLSGAHHAPAQAIDPAVPAQSVQEGAPGFITIRNLGLVTADYLSLEGQ